MFHVLVSTTRPEEMLNDTSLKEKYYTQYHPALLRLACMAGVKKGRGRRDLGT